MKLWLDDYRRAPVGWFWAKTYDECISYLQKGTVEELSLDHDLTEEHMMIGAGSSYLPDSYDNVTETGYHVVLFMRDNNIWPKLIRVHSASELGRKRIQNALEKFKPNDVQIIMMGPGQRP